MSNSPSPDRRQFLKATSAGALLASLPGYSAFGEERTGLEICTFTKPLQSLSYTELARAIAKIGLDGIEAPVRPGGHVLPEKVEEDLPKLVEALKAEDLSLTLLTSAINEVSEEQHTEKLLRTAAGLGIKRFRMGYYKYDLDRPIAPQVDEFVPRYRDLVALCREIGIKPIYQNHSGKNYFGGPIWDLAEVLEEFDPAHAGVAFDIGHATVEGAKAWPLNFARIRSHIDTVYIKEPGWKDNHLEWGPVGSGCVDPAFFAQLKKSGFQGPISLHVEYLGHKDPKMVPTILEAIEKDFATVTSLLS